MSKQRLILLVSVLCLAMAWSGNSVLYAEDEAVADLASSAFSYQGQLEKDGLPINSACDFQFELYNAASDGAKVGESIAKSAVAVQKGIFVTELDFGSASFDGTSRWLSIAVRCPAGGNGALTTLAPRQPLSSTPYAIYAKSAATALDLPWQNLSDTPQGLDDGDNDTLALLKCAASQVSTWNGEAWICADAHGVPGPKGDKGEIGETGPAGQDGISPAQVVWVAKSGGNFTTITDALASITDATEVNRYLIKVAPGVYEEYIDLKSYVDIEGSGVGVTIIRSIGGNDEPHESGNSATVLASATIDAELRFLSVESVAGNGINAGVAIQVGGSSRVRLDHVSAYAEGGSVGNWGIYIIISTMEMTHVTVKAVGGSSGAIGIEIVASDTTKLDNVRANASSIAILNDISASDMNNVEAHGGLYGVYNLGPNGGSAIPSIRNSKILGGPNSIVNAGGAILRVANTMLLSPVSGPGYACVGVYNHIFVALNTSCAP